MPSGEDQFASLAYCAEELNFGLHQGDGAASPQWFFEANAIAAKNRVQAKRVFPQASDSPI
jgi:hypothetical protein